MIKTSVSKTVDAPVKPSKQRKIVKAAEGGKAVRKKNVASSPDKTVQNTTAWLGKETRRELLDKLLGEFLNLHTEAMESVKAEVSDPIKRVEALTRLSQALDRTLNALVKATPQTPHLTIAQHVLKHQVAFVEANFPHHAVALLTILEPFGEELIQIFTE
jgi:hypothetical protein